MRAINTNIRWIATASCLLAISCIANAEEGVVRITDANKHSDASDTETNMTTEELEMKAAYERIRAQLTGHSVGTASGTLQQAGFRSRSKRLNKRGGCADFGCIDGACDGSACGGSACGGSACGGSACDGSACDGTACNDSFGACSACDGSGYTGRDDSGIGWNRSGGIFGGKANRKKCNSCFGSGYNNRVHSVLGNSSCRSGNCQAGNCQAGGCQSGGCQSGGCPHKGHPPFGKYHITYANNPGHTDARDGQVYGAQGYGTHLTVPIAPNVRYSYNYGSGIPSSRITPLGQYSGPGPISYNPHQSW